MALLSLVIPAIRGYLGAKTEKQPAGLCSGISKISMGLCWILIVIGCVFGLFGLHEYYSSLYSPMWVNVYMAVSCFVCAVIGVALSLLFKAIGTWAQRSKEQPTSLRSVEQYTHNTLQSIETEGLNLIKQHPFVTTLIGVSIGLLSGITSTKQK